MRTAVAVACLAFAACTSYAPERRWSEPEAPRLPPVESRKGDEIAVAGHLVSTGTRIVLWDEENAYNAYSLDPRFPDELRGREAPEGRRHSMRRGLDDDAKAVISERGWQLDELQDKVDQFVVHYDVCGTARQCFKVLHDLRKLSVHFMLDVDGTIYQTLDLKERAWHGTKANDRSVGIEIAHIGAYPRKEHRVLVQWYPKDAEGPRIRFPGWMKETGVRTADFVPRPSQKEPVEGVVQGTKLWQYDFTDEQYEALAHLVAALTATFPKIRLDAPRTDDGNVVPHVLAPDRFDSYQGVLGHYHVQKNKTDPGPAFDWDRVFARAREIRAASSQ